MKAAVCYRFGSPLEIADIVLEPPQAGEVLVRLVATGICYSDIHLVRGDWGGDLPVVAGHEAAGVVEDVGTGVAGVQPGDHVAVSLLRNCGQCFYCAHGMLHQCIGKFPSDDPGRLHTRSGETIHRGIHVASFAEYAVVHQSQTVKVPEDIPLDCAALLACAVITGVGAVTNTARVRPGSRVVVIGCGGVGLNTIQGAMLAGANSIIAMDVLESKLRVAKTFGATHSIIVGDGNLRENVLNLTENRGADYVFITVGSSEAVTSGLELVRPEGTLVVVGLPPVDATASLAIYDLVVLGKRIMGSSMGSTRLSVDVPPLIELYRQGRLKLDELITGRYSLDQINEAIKSTERGEAIRNVVTFPVPG
jgi:S-(hydroxymethyl)glutathione dehydrogenase / alcohol dehydrogenase